MSENFYNKSKEIANDYIQSIVFLDDRAYHIEEGTGQSVVNDLSAEKISGLFAKKKKICALYDPEKESDIDDFKEIALKSDIVVLDWFIDLEEHSKETDDLEEDAEEEDIRGKHTKDVITYLLDNNRDALKLVMVYTGETNLLEIMDEINNLSEDFVSNETNCSIKWHNLKILIRAKSNYQDGEDTRFKHLPHLKDKVLSYEELPDFVLDEFTDLTSGLLSNFALLALTTIRQNSNKILGVFNKNLDAAYLGHKAVLPYQNDSETLLIELFGQSMIDLLKYKNIDHTIQQELIDDFVNTIADLNLGKFERTSEILSNLLHSGEINIDDRFRAILPNPLTKKEKLAYVLNSTKLFSVSSDDTLINQVEKEFALITHQKNLFLPNDVSPVLTLGTVLKSTIHDDQYYICIQQRCDSVRIAEGTDRKFLFVPLAKVEGTKFNFLTTEGHKLKIAKTSFSLRTIKFICNNTNGVIEASKNEDKYIFQQIYSEKGGEHFEWVMDLKDLHSQRVVADFSAQLSRVGLDESEWLRRSATSK